VEVTGVQEPKPKNQATKSDAEMRKKKYKIGSNNPVKAPDESRGFFILRIGLKITGHRY